MYLILVNDDLYVYHFAMQPNWFCSALFQFRFCWKEDARCLSVCYSVYKYIAAIGVKLIFQSIKIVQINRRHNEFQRITQ